MEELFPGYENVPCTTEIFGAVLIALIRGTVVRLPEATTQTNKAKSTPARKNIPEYAQLSFIKRGHPTDHNVNVASTLPVLGAASRRNTKVNKLKKIGLAEI